MTSTTASDDLAVCTFVVADLLLGLSLATVSEVVHGPPLTPVPLAPFAVAGIFNLRGRVVTAVDARTRLGLPPRHPHESSAHVVVTVHGERTSLVVDRASDVLTLAGAEREAVPETVPAGIRSVVSAAYQRPRGLLLLLDHTLVLTT